MAAQAVFGACSEAEKSGKNDIKAMLTDPKCNIKKILSLLHGLWSGLPDTAKEKIDPEHETKRKNSGKLKVDRPKKIRKLTKSIHTEFKLDKEFMNKVLVWNNNPLSFFHEGESRLEMTESPFDGMNAYMEKLSNRTGMDKIRLRLLKVMYYRLSGCVGWTQMCQRRTRMAQITTNPDMSGWVNDGKRIDKLCRDIGSVRQTERFDQYFHLGNLFYSLQDVADYW
ncbi:hypothetical protein PENANT_c083G11243 [Penicillium antarcticum]|uniref:Uncharacterized protein n=1 Tax=Penicillium antarcticum TaxID=416450 RepID=A0A1V6PP12_9EURO|nr:hypothetical protein PENANT_c083G11243 [Penicillium antarcticum]